MEQSALRTWVWCSCGADFNAWLESDLLLIINFNSTPKQHINPHAWHMIYVTCYCLLLAMTHENKLATVTAHRVLTVTKMVTASRDWAVTEPWTGPWLSCDLAVTEPWSCWRCSQPAVTSPWLSCDLTVTELWPSRLYSSRDWAVIIGPRSHDHRGHRELTVSSSWAHGDHLFSHGDITFTSDSDSK